MNNVPMLNFNSNVLTKTWLTVKSLKDEYTANKITLCNNDEGSHPELKCIRRECDKC